MPVSLIHGPKAPNLPPGEADVPAAVLSLRSLPERLRAIVAGPAAGERCRQHPSPTLIEHAMYVRDLLAATASRLEHLADDVRPARTTHPRCEPVAGYHRWDPDALVADLVAEAEHVRRVTDRMAAAPQLSAAARAALSWLVADLLNQAMHDGAEELRQAEVEARA
jgi:hypothetical protein